MSEVCAGEGKWSDDVGKVCDGEGDGVGKVCHVEGK